jgi:hypothetical protein
MNAMIFRMCWFLLRVGALSFVAGAVLGLGVEVML